MPHHFSYLGFRSLTLAITAAFPAWAQDGALTIQRHTNPDHITLSAEALPPDIHHSLWFSEDMQHWYPAGSAQGSSLEYLDQGGVDERFFTLRSQLSAEVESSEDWKDQIKLGEDAFWTSFKPTDQDPFLGLPTNQKPTEWIKFIILLDDLSRVYFQNGKALPFHYDFGTRYLPGLIDQSYLEFDAATLYRSGQKAILGSVLYASKYQEYAIQFVGQDPLPAETVAYLYHLVDASISKPEPKDQIKGFYMPTYEQSHLDPKSLDTLHRAGITIASPHRWESPGDAVYAFGWAMGRLTYVQADHIDQAYRDGELKATDILLTDAVPAEVPRVAGLITLSPTTPNSHVAMLSRNFEIPFYYESDLATRTQLHEAVGRTLMLRASEGWGINRSASATVHFSILENPLPSEVTDAVDEFKEPQALNFKSMTRSGALILGMEGISPADTDRVGGKAAHFGFLQRNGDEHIPSPAVAITFDLWQDFLLQPWVTDLTLQAWIEQRLEQAQSSGLEKDLAEALAEIRTQIKSATFTQDQQEQILSGLSSFDPRRKLRFRSSTNLEDQAQFTGAGLYDSFSGCLEDDLDLDEAGPCACDPDQAKERGVFRAIKKVYASLYNENAYRERVHHGVNEHLVGMALLVHHSFPDEIEWGNGVAVVQFTDYSGGAFNIRTELVTQVDAQSVTNPNDSSIPETVSVSYYRPSQGNPSRSLRFETRSSLLQVGQDHVMDWQRDYVNLHRQIEHLTPLFARHASTPSQYTLDIEFKKVAPGKLIIKQIRELPQPVTLTEPTPILAGGMTHLRLFQGEARGSGGVFAYHRLKSQWLLNTASRVLDRAGQAESLILDATWNRVRHGSLENLSEGFSGWDNYAFRRGSKNNRPTLLDRWTEDLGEEQITYQWHTLIPSWLPDRYSPIVFTDELEIYFQATYQEPRQNLSINAWTGEIGTTPITEEEIRLEGFNPYTGVEEGDLLQTRSIKGKGDHLIEIQFYWPAPPTGPTAGYTAPLKQWKATRIEGLTPEPIMLTSWYSQTYAPGHHNFWEEFIFEPAQEESLPPAQRQALEAAGIQNIYVFDERGGASQAIILGNDGTPRPF
jgi:hypothetical protein